MQNKRKRIIYLSLTAIFYIFMFVLLIKFLKSEAFLNPVISDKVARVVAPIILILGAIFVVYSIIISIIRKHDEILSFFRQSYTYKILILMVFLSLFPIMLIMIIYKHYDSSLMRIYFYLILPMVIVLSLAAAATLKPKLNFKNFMKLFIVTTLLFLGYLYWVYSITVKVLGPVSFSVDVWIPHLLFYWVFFLAVWFLWHLIKIIIDKVPASTKQVIQQANQKYQTFSPDFNFLINSLKYSLFYPLIISVAYLAFYMFAGYQNSVFILSEIEKTNLRVGLSILGVITGAIFLGFILLSIFKVYKNKISYFRITKDKYLNKLLFYIWEFILLWIFFSSTSFLINFISPGQYEYLDNHSDKIELEHFFRYTITLFKREESTAVVAVGKVASTIRPLTMLLGWLIVATLPKMVSDLFEED